MTIYNEIEDFFTSYLDAFGRNDPAALREHWDSVGLFPSPTGNFAMTSEAFRAHCTTLMDFYRRQGVVQSLGKLLSSKELFPDVVEARMAYRLLSNDEELVAEWEHVYILRRTDRWRISLTIADGELAAWAARGAQI